MQNRRSLPRTRLTQSRRLLSACVAALVVFSLCVAGCRSLGVSSETLRKAFCDAFCKDEPPAETPPAAAPVLEDQLKPEPQTEPLPDERLTPIRQRTWSPRK